MILRKVPTGRFFYVEWETVPCSPLPCFCPRDFVCWCTASRRSKFFGYSLVSVRGYVMYLVPPACFNKGWKSTQKVSYTQDSDCFRCFVVYSRVQRKKKVV